MKLWYETHSTSIDNERGVASGQSDAPLSSTGRQQAAELGLRYGEHEVRTVYTSDLVRAATTGEIAFAGRGIPIIADARLRECDYGEWSGCPAHCLRESQHLFIEHPFPGGESFRDVVRRIESFLRELRSDDGPILVVSHRVPWYAFEHLIRGRDLVEVIGSTWQWQPGWEYEL